MLIVFMNRWIIIDPLGKLSLRRVRRKDKEGDEKERDKGLGRIKSWK
jgi:hypothetical protein